MMKTLLFLLRIISVILLTGLYWLTSVAQEPSEVYLLRDNALLTLNSMGMQMEAADLQALALPVIEFNVAAEPRYVASADIAEDPLTLYVLMHQGQLSAQLPFPTQTQILRIDVETQTSTVIFDRQGIFTFVLSPNGQRMIVGYYESDYYFSAQRACVLDLRTNLCDSILYQTGNLPGHWVDNTTFLVGSVNDLSLHLINVETGADQVILRQFDQSTWNYGSSILIPNTRSILVAAERRDLTQTPWYALFVIDFDTYDAQMLAYAENFTTALWSFSPDGQYLLLQSDQFKLIEFRTGRVMSTFDRVLNFGWESNNVLVVQGIMNANETPIIARIDTATGLIQPLARGEDAAGILIVP